MHEGTCTLTINGYWQNSVLRYVYNWDYWYRHTKCTCRQSQQLNKSKPSTAPVQAPPLALGVTTETIIDLPPPDCLIHPVLLEKMRLNGSPSPLHSQLTTLNINQSDRDMHDAFYDLHKTNPFPRLPPYYVHKSKESHMEQVCPCSSRPPSGKSKSEVSLRPDSGKVISEDSSQSKRNTLKIVAPNSLVMQRRNRGSQGM